MAHDELTSAQQEKILSMWRRECTEVDDDFLKRIASWYGYFAHIDVDPNDMVALLRTSGRKLMYSTDFSVDRSPAEAAAKLLEQCPTGPATTFNYLLFLILEPARISCLRGGLSALLKPLSHYAGGGYRAVWLAECPPGEKPEARLVLAERSEALPSATSASLEPPMNIASSVRAEDIPAFLRTKL